MKTTLTPTPWFFLSFERCQGMSLKYTCPICGTPLGWMGACAGKNAGLSRERRTDCPGHRNKSQRNRKALFRNIQRLGDVEALELTDSRQQEG